MTTDSSSFTKLVPGFEFLQSLVKNAGAALPGIGQWVAPTLDPAELEKRIADLRTVQFWLEQNARMLATTIQALEVQRMTLSTLQTMNVQMEDLRDSLQIRMPQASEPAPAPAPAARSWASPPPSPAPAPTAAAPLAAPAAPETTDSAEAAAPAVAAAPGVDPLQWWGALTKQFAEIATTAMKDTASDASRKLASAMVTNSLASPAPSAADGGETKAASQPPKTATAKAAAKAVTTKKATAAKKAAPDA